MNKKGFTIVEMLGVVTILVIISLFTFPLITTLMTDSNNSKNKQFLELLYQASESYIEINYDKYKNEEIGYISAKKLVEEGYLQTDYINPITKLKITEEDGIVEVSRNVDRTFKFNYVINQYIVINYVEDLIEILNNTSDYKNKIIVLSKDLDINDDKSYLDKNSKINNITPKTIFKGKLIGNGYQIKNININSENDNIGLFSLLDGATIENIRLQGQISGKNNVGLLAGSANNSKINNVSVDTKFTYNTSINSDSVGALIGSATNTEINNVNSKIDFTVNGNNIGGIVGKITSSIITKSNQEGFINGNQNVGGIIGSSESTTINALTAKGRIFGNENIGGLIGNSSKDNIINANSSAITSGSNNIGGIIGNASNTKVEKNYVAGEVSGINNIGGIIGYAQGNTNISKSNTTSEINGIESVGGIVGNLSASEISDCYSLSSIAADKQLGGLIGVSSSSTLSNSYYSGMILSNANNNIGGLIGISSSSTILNTYYNLDLVKYDLIGSTTNDTKTNVAGKTKEEMQTQETYQDWDFVNIWKIDSNNYPTLR